MLVVFVTGRPVRWMEALWQHVGAHGLAICSNGGVVYDVAAGAVRSYRTIPVEVGLDVVAVGQTLCILEAMKLMNEVKTEIDGVVRAIHAQNGQPVEFGQPLFDLEPALSRPLDAF